MPKWVLIVWLKIPQMPQKISVQNVYPSPKILDSLKKSSPWVSVVCAWIQWSAMHLLNLSLYSIYLHIRMLKIMLTPMLHFDPIFLDNVEDQEFLKYSKVSRYMHWDAWFCHQCKILSRYQRYTYRVLQTLQMKLILLCVWAERAVLGIAKTALRFKYEI